jgi:DNA-binding transcriptional LysR family regulator
MDLSLLRTCLAVYRTGSLTKAARQLGISQPAVTGQLRTLETRLDQKLFLRMPHGTVPTDAGRELIRETATALDSLEAALGRRLEPKGLSDRAIRLAGPHEIISSRVLPAIADLISDGLRLYISFGLADELLAELAEGMHDLVISTSQPRHPAISSMPLMDEEFALVGAPRWAEQITPEDINRYGPAALKDVPVLAYADTLPIIQRYWMTVFSQRPEIDVPIVVPDLRAILAAVKVGAGVSVIPVYLCADDIARGDIKVLYEPRLPPLNTLFLAGRTDGRAGVGLTTLRSHLLMKARLWQ